MAKDLDYLAKFMGRAAEALERDAHNFAGDVAFSVHSAVVELTPVDVGTARSNWTVRLGSPWSMVYRAFAPLPSKWRGGAGGVSAHPGRAESGNREAARRQAAGVLERRKGDETIYITNNLPYIGRLNAGYSQQSPSNFVQSGISLGIRSAVARFRFDNLRRIR